MSTPHFNRFTAVAGALLLAFAAALYLFSGVRGSDHQDSPATVGRPGADITDVFIFPAADPKNVVLAMNIHPLIPRGEYAGISFDPGVMYQFKIDTTGDAHEDKVIQFRAVGNGADQRIEMYGPAAPSQAGTLSTWVGNAREAAFNRVTRFSDGSQLLAGPRKDPFYFDLAQFLKIIPDRDYKNQPNPPPPTASCFRKPGIDGLRGYDVLSLIVEVPRSQLAGADGKLGVIRVYATTSTQQNGQWRQIERLARPAVKEATEQFKLHDITNRSTPWNDPALRQSVYGFMIHVAHRSPALAKAVTTTLIPDEMEANLAASGPARYLAVETLGKSGLPVGVVRVVPAAPLGGIKKAIANPVREFGGRDPSSPVIDLSLGVIFGSLGNKVGLAPDDHKETPCLTSDNVQPSDRGVTKTFPYVGNPI